MKIIVLLFYYLFLFLIDVRFSIYLYFVDNNLICDLYDEQRVYELGGRNIMISEIRPVGCMPRISRVYPHAGPCVEELNQMVTCFNQRLPPLIKNLTSTLPASNFVLIRSNSIEYDAIRNPSKYGKISEPE